MMPQLARRGTSFKGCYLYYFHDKKASTSERVEWTHTRNMMSDDPAKCWRVMAYTAKHQSSLKQASGQKMTGAKMKKPAFAYSIAWHPEQSPEKAEMLEAANQTLEALGLTEHEVMMAAHRDEPQKHVHVIVNTVHPVTGLVADMSYSKRKIQDWATEYERKQGKIYCKMREDKYEKRKQGQNTNKYTDPNVIEAWAQSKDAEGFKQLMEKKGYQLAQGRKRMVIVDDHGRTFNPTRLLSAVYGKGAPDKFRERMEKIDQTELPTPAQILKERAAQQDTPVTTTKIAQSFNKAAVQSKSVEQKANRASNDSKSPRPRKQLEKRDIEPIAKIRRVDDLKISSPANDNKNAQQQQKELKRTAFKERVARAMDSRIMAHYDERSSLTSHYHRKLIGKKEELGSYYQFEEKQQYIDELKQKLKQPSFLQKIANHFFGAENKIREEITTRTSTQKNAQQRYNEQIKIVESQQKEALEKLKLRQREELMRLRQNFRRENSDEKTLSQQWKRVAHQQRSRHKYPDKGRDGPSYSR